MRNFAHLIAIYFKDICLRKIDTKADVIFRFVPDRNGGHLRAEIIEGKFNVRWRDQDDVIFYSSNVF